MIHTGNPFADSRENPAKRFRGRLASPVAIITSGSGERRTGLTVSSLFVVDGEQAQMNSVVGPNSDLFDVAGQSGRFIVHVCGERDAGLADIFAGIRPSPGGLFATTESEDTEWGPVIKHLPNRAYCTTTDVGEVGWSGVLLGTVDRFEVEDLIDPLVYFRGAYRSLA